MKDRPQSSVYVPPHQRLRSLITVPPPNGSKDYHQGFTPIRSSSPNDGRNSPVDFSVQKNHNQDTAIGGDFQFNSKQETNGYGTAWNSNENGGENLTFESFHYKFYTPSTNYAFHVDRQHSDSQRSSAVNTVSEVGSHRDFVEFESSSYSFGVSNL